MDIRKIEKVFPQYFKNFKLPPEAKEQKIEVYRACPTGKIEKASFLNTYEENGFKNTPDKDVTDPQEYCLSTYIRLKDIKRFVIIDSRFQPPWLLATGATTVVDGVSCKTADWKKTKGSHVDWWLYENAEPWLAFKETTYEYEYENFPERR